MAVGGNCHRNPWTIADRVISWDLLLAPRLVDPPELLFVTSSPGALWTRLLGVGDCSVLSELNSCFVRETRIAMAVESRVTQEEIKKEPEKPVDREKTCPLLLRVFTTNNGRHHRMDEFARGNVPSSELQIYTWMDATLKELTSLVKEVYPEARKKGTHFGFAIVYPDPKRQGYRVKDIGNTISGRKGADDSMTLQSQRFQIGDYLDIAITPPNRAPPLQGRMRPY
ncbi:hypothetical protein NFI96_015392 [Prochilodus magdalenae]|nr:hypothetical protein NFI96_015392 [Prochilodus magdalenae]